MGELPLKLLCPRLLQVALLPDALVSSCGFWDGFEWRWSLLWTRDLRPRDCVERETLQTLLGRVVLLRDKADDTIGTPSKTDEFSVKSLSLELAKQDPPVNLDAVKGM